MFDPEFFHFVDELEKILKPFLFPFSDGLLKGVEVADLPTVEAVCVVVGDAVDGRNANQGNDD